MKKLLALLLTLAAFSYCFIGCSVGDKYNHEKFYGVVRFSENCNRLVIYIPNIGDVEIPESEGYCSCFNGHEENDDYSYTLKSGDLVAINFRYEKSWDNNSVAIMESYPARFDRKAHLVEALAENISFDKADEGYVLSFPKDKKTAGTKIGDSLYFIYHEGKNGFDSTRLYATGEIVSKTDGIITVALTLHGEESEFLAKYTSISIELT